MHKRKHKHKLDDNIVQDTCLKVIRTKYFIYIYIYIYIYICRIEQMKRYITDCKNQILFINVEI